VNTAWKKGVDGNTRAWAVAAVSILGSMHHATTAEISPAHAQETGQERHLLHQRVPMMVAALLGRPPPIVIDIGTGYTKAGFAGQPSPIIVCPNFAVASGIQDMFVQDVQPVYSCTICIRSLVVDHTLPIGMLIRAVHYRGMNCV
jgi:hypothetical protein